MTREEALDLLRSPSTHQRLKASRQLARNAGAEDLDTLQAARSTESDSYVKGSLDRAIARLTETNSSSPADETEDFDVSETSSRQIYARATEYVAGLLLHEIAPPIGLLAFNASREVPNYDRSTTKKHITSLQTIFAAIEQLRTASATPKPAEVDLAGLINSLVETEFVESSVEIATQGPNPLVLISDDGLLRFAICNGLRNAVEAVSATAIEKHEPIVIAWGETDVDYWLSIIDRGSGISGSVEPVFGIGKTTKKGHSGFGLAIARAAIEALNGNVSLQPATGVGTKYELRWEKWQRAS